MEDYQRTNLAPEKCQALRDLLHNLGYGAGMEGLYWLPLPVDALLPLQQEHVQSCGPYAMAVEIASTSVSMELLVRARNSLCCDCIHPATPEQAQCMQASFNNLLASAGIAPTP